MEKLRIQAVYQSEVEKIPVIVVVDSNGNNLYESGRADYLALAGGKQHENRECG